MRIPRHAADNVLALDIATHFGYAIGRFGERISRHGASTLTRVEHVQRQADLRGWIEDAEKIHGRFTALAVEAAMVGGFSSQDATRITIALHSTVALWCYDVGIPLVACPVTTIRKTMIGRGTFPKGQAKPAVVAWCRANGIHPENDDAADAILLWKAVERFSRDAASV